MLSSTSVPAYANPGYDQRPDRHSIPHGGQRAAPKSSAQSITRQWLVGHWNYEANCENDNYVIYRANGAMEDSSSSGTWSLQGDILTTIIRIEQEMGEEPRRLARPAIQKVRIKRLGPNAALVDGRHKMIRCR